MNKALSYDEFQSRVSGVILTEEGNCPVMSTVGMIQGKWKLQIIYELCIKDRMRFGELRKMLGNITNTMLTSALRELEKDGILFREQFNEIPPRVEYSLTQKGKDLLPVFHAIVNWGMKYTP